MGRDIEKRSVTVRSGAGTEETSVANTSIAIRQDEWVNLEFWGEPLCSDVATYIRKGERIAVRGRLKSDTYMNKTTFKVRVDRVSKVLSRDAGGGNAPGQEDREFSRSYQGGNIQGGPSNSPTPQQQGNMSGSSPRYGSKPQRPQQGTTTRLMPSNERPAQGARHRTQR